MSIVEHFFECQNLESCLLTKISVRKHPCAKSKKQHQNSPNIAPDLPDPTSVCTLSPAFMDFWLVARARRKMLDKSSEWMKFAILICATLWRIVENWQKTIHKCTWKVLKQLEMYQDALECHSDTNLDHSGSLSRGHGGQESHPSTVSDRGLIRGQEVTRFWVNGNPSTYLSNRCGSEHKLQPQFFG